MKFKKIALMAFGLILGAMPMQSCLDDDDDKGVYMSGLVTVYPEADGSFIMHLDNNTALRPVNVPKSPFGNKEVRALVTFNDVVEGQTKGTMRDVQVYTLDSIRTKLPIPTVGEANDSVFGKDPFEIANSWLTVAEDGYFTAQIMTYWSSPVRGHEFNLVSGVNPENPLEFELRHNAHGDYGNRMESGLIAFNLKELVKDMTLPVKIKVNWTSFSGPKSAEFELDCFKGVTE